MGTRFFETIAVTLVGDGVVGAVMPVRHSARWVRGPRPWQQAMRFFVDRPGLTRGLAVAEAAIGLVWVARLPLR